MKAIVRGRIVFNKPLVLGGEEACVQDAIRQRQLSAGHAYFQKCEQWFESEMRVPKACLVTSCSQALEFAALLIEIQPGDEIIMPSYTFVSTANAFVIRGAVPVFIDVDPSSMNMDIALVETAITAKTKAIIPMHYAGVPCDMEALMELASKYDLFVIEDAAQAIGVDYQGRTLGSLGHLGCVSFHETKNITCGEGGLLAVNEASLVERAEILQKKGTNRSQFDRGVVDKYCWLDVGGSYLLNELSAAFLWPQLQQINQVNDQRHALCQVYHRELEDLEQQGVLQRPQIVSPNGHIYYIKLRDMNQRQALIDYLEDHNICAVMHYVPLHSAPAGRTWGKMHGFDQWTTLESERLLRLPLFYDLTEEDVMYIVHVLRTFFQP